MFYCSFSDEKLRFLKSDLSKVKWLPNHTATRITYLHSYYPQQNKTDFRILGEGRNMLKLQRNSKLRISNKILFFLAMAIW